MATYDPETPTPLSSSSNGSPSQHSSVDGSGFATDASLATTSSYGSNPTLSLGISDGGLPTTTAAFPPVSEPLSLGNGAPSASSSTAACLGCRSKHLKCDFQKPCSRCASSNLECVYIASRRGYKGPRKATTGNPNKRQAVSSPDSSSSNDAADSCPMMLGHPRIPVSMQMPTSTASAFSPAIVLPPDTQAGTPYTTAAALSGLQVYRAPFTTGLELAAAAATRPTMLQPVRSLEERCFDSFYLNFWGGHPFILPRDYFLRLMKEGSAKLDPLIASMRYIGSLYLDAGPAREIYFDEALRLCYLPGTSKDGFLVQAMLLLIVGLDGSCQQEKARQLLADVEQYALEISLNTRDYAILHGRGNPVMEESWRRTWWDLYVCDGMVAGVHRITNFLLFDIHADVGLPCEEHEYRAGTIPSPMFLEDFEDQLFSGEDREFSSSAYRIAAIRNLGRFMRTPPMLAPNDPNIDKVESLLSNWKMHLPPTKRDSLNKDCQLDEMMFQAHFITHACTIMLHQPFSQLDSSPARAVTSCAPHRPVASGDVFNAHTRHTLSAALEISKMVTQAVPLLSHTHFFTCVVTLSSIVHLSKWAMYYIGDDDDLRQQIRLNLGALAKLSEVWKAASTACGQVRGVAQEIYRAKKAAQAHPAFWVGFTQEEMITSLNADDGIINDLEGMLSHVAQVTQGH